MLALWARNAAAMAVLLGLYLGEMPILNWTSPRVPLSGLTCTRALDQQLCSSAMVYRYTYGVLGAKVHEQDEVDDFAGDEVRVPRLKSIEGDAEAVDLLGHRDDVVELRDARVARPVARGYELLEVAAKGRRAPRSAVGLLRPQRDGDSRPESSGHGGGLRRRSCETKQLVVFLVFALLVGGLSLRRLSRGVGRRLLEDEPLDEELNDAVEGAVSLLGKAAQPRNAVSWARGMCVRRAACEVDGRLTWRPRP